jgi:hypothetical protein
MIGIRGEGGIGKSTLMAKVFAESLGFAGKFWADVRTGTSIAALAERSLQEKDLIPRLLRQLQPGRYLLTVDNLESVLTAEGDWRGGYEEFLDSFQNLGSESVLLLAGREYPQKYSGWRRSRCFDRLTSAQQYLLTQVSVLRGAFDAELATALVLEPPVSNADLHDLERRSLLQELPKLSQDAPMYRLWA